MEEEAEIFIGLDVAKVKHAVAIAEEGRSGEVRYFGEINSDAPSVRRMVARLEKHNKRLHFAMKLSHRVWIIQAIDGDGTSMQRYSSIIDPAPSWRPR